MSGGVAVATASTLRGTGLTKIYKKRRVVSEVDIQVRQREIVALEALRAGCDRQRSGAQRLRGDIGHKR